MDVCVKFSDNRLNSDRIIPVFGQPAGSVLRTFVQYLTACCSRPETVIVTSYPGGLWRQIVHDQRVIFRDPRLNRSREIPLEAVGFVIFIRFSNVNNVLAEVVSDVVSGTVVDPIGMKVFVKLGDFTLHRSRDIGLLPHSLCDERRRRRRRWRRSMQVIT